MLSPFCCRHAYHYRSIGTPLQLRLRHLDVGHDRAIPVTARSLLAHTFLTTRNSLAQRFEDMSVDLTEDFNYMNRMVKESSANAENHWQAGGRRATPMIGQSLRSLPLLPLIGRTFSSVCSERDLAGDLCGPWCFSDAFESTYR